MINTSISLSRVELLAWAQESLAFHRLDLSRVSTVFLVQAYSSEINRIFDTFDLTMAIKYLEGIEPHSNTPEADQFKYPPLTGLYKKHFSSARFLPKSISNFVRSKAGKAHFDEIWDKAVANSSSEYLDESFIKYLAHHITIEPIEIKSQNKAMTGEWVVFNRHNNLNYYLAIASHKESNEDIHKKVSLACEMDGFPFSL